MDHNFDPLKQAYPDLVLTRFYRVQTRPERTNLSGEMRRDSPIEKTATIGRRIEFSENKCGSEGLEIEKMKEIIGNLERERSVVD